MDEATIAEFALLLEMLERIGAALHAEAQAPRVSHQRVGAQAANLELISRQLKQLAIRTLEDS